MRDAGGTSIPELSISFRKPWHRFENTEQQGRIQDELLREVGPLHPLWNAGAIVFANRVDQDDVAVWLADGRLAIVHFVWHGRIDQFPDQVPNTQFFDSLSSFQRAIDADAED